MEIKREKYIRALSLRKNNGMIKVVTGIRRSGKTYLLFKLFRDALLAEGVPESHIISMELDLFRNRKYREPEAMLDYVESCILDDEQYYILIDEVQMLDSFEEVLNTFLHMRNVDVYVTGSNSRFLSRDVITEFRGRGDEIHVFPLSFGEFMTAYPGDVYHGWDDYVVYGGLPQTVSIADDEMKAKYLRSLFEETYLRDIIERYRVEKQQELNDLLNVLASSVGSLTNPPKIEATFRSVVHSDISQNTIRQYIEYLKDAFILSEANRYDVKGRKYIGSPLKYYFEDVGLRNARLGFRQIEETHLMENIIYNELRYRGFQVDVGVVGTRTRADDGRQQRGQLEVDFVANKGSRRYYIQSAFRLPDEEKLKQEKASLLRLDDSFKKMIVVKDVIKPRQDDNGILIMGLFDFLQNENSLDA